MRTAVTWPGRGGWLAILVCAGTLAVAGCQPLPSGPSLTAFELSGITGRPTIGDRLLCCCHVSGTATNRTTVPLHATITFSGFDARDQEISKIVYFMQDMAPGQSRQVDAPGFIVPCAAISRFSWEVKVRGITYPPL
jgi:hypothetical protein